ncbi:MAG: hypothetical protein LRY71_14140 [Bacillaceae bacterium]|nr:hypothetical protein [Bacillaceae bacterium]
MKFISDKADKLKSRLPENNLTRTLLATLVSVLVLAANLFVHSFLLNFIATTSIHPILVAIFAIAWGIVGIYVLFLSINFSVELYPDVWSQRLQPFVFYRTCTYTISLVIIVTCCSNI